MDCRAAPPPWARATKARREVYRRRRVSEATAFALTWPSSKRTGRELPSASSGSPQGPDQMQPFRQEGCSRCCVISCRLAARKVARDTARPNAIKCHQHSTILSFRLAPTPPRDNVGGTGANGRLVFFKRRRGYSQLCIRGAGGPNAEASFVECCRDLKTKNTEIPMLPWRPWARILHSNVLPRKRVGSTKPWARHPWGGAARQSMGAANTESNPLDKTLGDAWMSRGWLDKTWVGAWMPPSKKKSI